MVVHERGWKSGRDRARLIAAYDTLCKTHRIPERKRLTLEQTAKMSNLQLYQATQDLFISQEIKRRAKEARSKKVRDAIFLIPSRVRNWLTFHTTRKSNG